MALLPQDPKQQRLLIVGAAFLVGFYVFYSYWYSPRQDEIADLETRLENLDAQNRRAQVLATRGREELQERLQVYERHVERLEQLIPQSEEVPQLLNDMALEARRADVELALVRPEPSQQDEFYDKRSYSLAVIGPYHRAARFISSIASMPRIITPVDLEVTPASTTASQEAEEDEFFLEFLFRIETYVLPAAPQGGGEEASTEEPS